MPLTKYKQKRRFNETPEPAGKIKKSAGDLTFVIQKHQASHLHYDFRLEMEGVLRSWAVPKGPSLNPKDKRLAMMVEDHPLDYGSFEGHIPEGNYGAGDVIVWDNGTYYAAGSINRKQSEELMLKGIKAGKVDFFMEGHKLKGEFSLVKFKRGAENAWLLVKKDDAYADESKNILEKEESVISGKKVVEKKKIKTAPTPPSRSARHLPLAGEDNGSAAVSPPAKGEHPAKRGEGVGATKNIKPMLSTLVDEPFDNKDWLFEIKWDGYRAIAEVDGRHVRLYSRRGLSFNEKYPAIVAALTTVQHPAVLDGEIVVLDEAGKPNFQMLQNYGREGKGQLAYYVFDILFLDGNDVAQLPLIQRKKLLANIIPKKSLIRLSDHIEGKGKGLFEQAQQQGLEGIIAKNSLSTYQEGVRGPEWVKIKTHKRQEAIICGFTEPKGSRHYFGSLVLGIYDEGKLKYVGNSGSGFNHESLKVIYDKLKPLVVDRSPFSYRVTALAPITWIKPELICEVEFTEWTENGQMRHPIFQGLREDKKPEEVKKETESKTQNVIQKITFPRGEPSREAIKSISMTSSEPQLTHLEKLYWPKEGITKGELIEYYDKISPIILPYLKDRPENLLRHPSGVERPGFFQKDVIDHPPFVKTVTIPSESAEKDIHYLICNDKDTLLYMNNLGCIEINPWNARFQNIDKPDYMVIDLDPGDIKFEKTVEVALAVHELLDDIGAANFCKTSGKTGLHIFVPLGAKYTNEQSRRFAELIANVVYQHEKSIASITRNPAKRRTCVYIDYLQNREGQTLAAPYSVRPWPGATVSTPLEWKEVNKKLDPAKFTIKTIFKRLDKLGDLWKPVLGKGIDLQKVLKKLEGQINVGQVVSSK